MRAFNDGRGLVKIIKRGDQDLVFQTLGNARRAAYRPWQLARLLPFGAHHGVVMAAVEGPFERHDEATLAVFRGHHAIQEHGLDRVFHRFASGVHDEVARRAGRRDAVEFGLEAQGQEGLVFGMRIARRHEWQRLEDGPDHCRIVLAERVCGDEGAHVEEAVWLAGSVAVDHREIRSHGLGGIEGYRQ